MIDAKPGFAPTVGAAPNEKETPQYPVARRSPRVAIDMPVAVVGKNANGTIFRQEMRTTIVNAHGAHLMLSTMTEIEPSILLINKKTGREAQCRLAHQKRTGIGKYELGIEFITPQTRFWDIAFPPEDWSRAERKIPAFTPR